MTTPLTPCKLVLIIEDDRAIQRMLKSYLEIEGYTVALASDGQEGIDALQNLHDSPLPCVILLDMMMPRVTGWEFLDFQRNDARFSQIPVLVVSAYPEIARSVKPHQFIPKPVQADALMDALEAYCA